MLVAAVQSLGPVQLFEIPWTAVHQASLSFTNSWSLFKLASIDSVMPSNHLVLWTVLGVFVLPLGVQEAFPISQEQVGLSSSGSLLNAGNKKPLLLMQLGTPVDLLVPAVCQHLAQRRARQAFVLTVRYKEGGSYLPSFLSQEARQIIPKCQYAIKIPPHRLVCLGLCKDKDGHTYVMLKRTKI